MEAVREPRVFQLVAHLGDVTPPEDPDLDRGQESKMSPLVAQLSWLVNLPPPEIRA